MTQSIFFITIIALHAIAGAVSVAAFVTGYPWFGLVLGFLTVYQCGHCHMTQTITPTTQVKK